MHFRSSGLAMYAMPESVENSDSELSDSHTIPTPDSTPLKLISSAAVVVQEDTDISHATVEAGAVDSEALRRSGRRRGPRLGSRERGHDSVDDSQTVLSKSIAEAEQRVTKKRRTRPVIPRDVFHFEPPYAPASAHDKGLWGGFCELESDPAVFNNVLHNLGVDGVKVQEVYSLDQEMLEMLPHPVHGLIFLFEYTDEADDAKSSKDCPSHVWFANQVVDNCCGTIALLNVINNIPATDLLLSDQMQSFRSFSMPFTPAFRGDQVASCPLIKRAHNAYARQIDMWNADLIVQDKWTQARKKSRKSKGRGGNRRKARTDSAYHFVAYMPIQNELWRMDGLDDCPQSLGRFEYGQDKWLSEVTPLLSAQMTAYAEKGVQFSLLAVVRDAAASTKLEIAKTSQMLHDIESKLTALRSDWQMTKGAIVTHSPGQLSSDATLEKEDENLNHLPGAADFESLLELRNKTIKQQQDLSQRFESEQSTSVLTEADTTSEVVRALDRQNDYVPFIQKWLMMLAENQRLKDLVETHSW